jgi:hypothetical protein
MWVLRTILPEQYRTGGIVGPGPDPPDENAIDVDAAYVGLYTMIIALIQLAGGQMPETQLDRLLRRMNADESTPVDSKDKLFARMIKDGYIVRIKDTSSGDEVIEYVVGPRGKVEVDKQSVASFVRTVCGDGVENLEQRITRSLGLGEEVDGSATAGAQDAVRRPGRPRRRASDDE